MTTWFITGASSGIGAELARQLARRGDDVALAARRSDRLAALADELADAPGTVTVHELDVTDHRMVAAAMRAADEAHGGLDVAVANAGIGGGRAIGAGGQAANESVVATRAKVGYGVPQGLKVGVSDPGPGVALDIRVG